MLYTFPQRAGVLELVDEVDSKSITSDGVRVRVPPPAPEKGLMLCIRSFSMKFVPCGTSEILLRNMKYASRMKYASGIWRNEFYFIFGTSRIFHNPQGLFHICRKANISLTPSFWTASAVKNPVNRRRSITGRDPSRCSEWNKLKSISEKSTPRRAFFNEIRSLRNEWNITS